MSDKLCQVQFGSDMILSKLQIQENIRSEISQMLFAVQSCREGN